MCNTSESKGEGHDTFSESINLYFDVLSRRVSPASKIRGESLEWVAKLTWHAHTLSWVPDEQHLRKSAYHLENQGRSRSNLSRRIWNDGM